MICKSCGKEIGNDSKFCPLCGAKQVTVYRQDFVRNGLSEESFIESINQWLRENPKAANIKATIEIDTGFGLLANKYQLNRFTVNYELFRNENTNQYALVKEESLGLINKSAKEFVEEWKQSHPDWKVVTWRGGTHARGSSASLLLNGIGARNRTEAYILYKFPRK